MKNNGENLKTIRKCKKFKKQKQCGLSSRTEFNRNILDFE